MSVERYSELVRLGINGLVPEGVVNKIEGSFDNLQELSSWREDLPHSLPHVIETTAMIKHFDTDRPFLKPMDAWRAYMAGLWHDKGHIFVRKGVLAPEEHQYGSVYYAWRMGADSDVLAAIALHVEDVLPPQTPVWVKAVRDFDRVSRLGYTGVNNIVYYEGFWGDDPDEERVTYATNNRILCETLWPGVEDLEDNAKTFFETEVASFLYSKGYDTIWRVIEMIREMERRTLGDTRNDLEPVMREVQEDWETKFLHTKEIVERLYWLNNVVRTGDTDGYKKWLAKVENDNFPPSY